MPVACFDFRMRRILWILAAMLVVLGNPVTANADDTLARLARPAPVSSFDSRILWSEYDAGANAILVPQTVGRNSDVLAELAPPTRISTFVCRLRM